MGREGLWLFIGRLAWTRGRLEIGFPRRSDAERRCVRVRICFCSEFVGKKKERWGLPGSERGRGREDAREREVAAALLGVPPERTCVCALALALGWVGLWLGLGVLDRRI